VRVDKKPTRAESSSPEKFRFRVNRSYQRVNGCYCASARLRCSGGLREKVCQTKDAERRDKLSVQTGEDTGPRQGR